MHIFLEGKNNILFKYIPDIKPTDRKISTLDLAKDDKIVPQPIKKIPILVVNLWDSISDIGPTNTPEIKTLIWKI